ncbi:hypothetical protein P691DRAFT_785997 [Macrolepiota fuliginosa MF-IS2]|uniref:Uncharacterized protein n=1 Tax=Macrolepiota fuliginosa MF-IS2 TaxID=1400762 RepID=A0A9P6C0Q5_9AGAR|nr:hypothetical protein P691DRAFT_785997 [Macrolepiota fuliginosa MF-IS2]
MSCSKDLAKLNGIRLANPTDSPSPHLLLSGEHDLQLLQHPDTPSWTCPRTMCAIVWGMICGYQVSELRAQRRRSRHTLFLPPHLNSLSVWAKSYESKGMVYATHKANVITIIMPTRRVGWGVRTGGVGGIRGAVGNSSLTAYRLDHWKLGDAQPSKARALISHKWYRQALVASRWVKTKNRLEGRPKHGLEQSESEKKKPDSKPNEPQPLSSLTSPATPGSNPPSQPADPSPLSNPNTSPNLVVFTTIKVMMKCGQPYLGAFLLKGEHTGSDVITDVDSVHQVGAFAEIISVFAAAGQKGDNSAAGNNNGFRYLYFPGATDLPTSPPTPEPGVAPLSMSFVHNHAILICCQYGGFGDTRAANTSNVFDEPGKLTTFAAAVSASKVHELQDILESPVVDDRLRKALAFKKELIRTKKESDGNDRLISKFRERVKSLKVPEGVRKVFDEELVKLQGLELVVSGAQVTRNYLDRLTQIL